MPSSRAGQFSWLKWLVSSILITLFSPNKGSEIDILVANDDYGSAEAIPAVDWFHHLQNEYESWNQKDPQKGFPRGADKQ